MFSPDPETTIPTTTVNNHRTSSKMIVTNNNSAIPTDSHAVDNSSLLLVPNGYLVWSPQCKIASLNPMATDVRKLYHREKAISCSTKQPLTSVEWNPETKKYYLTVIESAKKPYHLSAADQCEYQEITRKSENHIR